MVAAGVILPRGGEVDGLLAIAVESGDCVLFTDARFQAQEQNREFIEVWTSTHLCTQPDFLR